MIHLSFAPVGMLLLLCCSALVSGSETALFSLRPAEIQQMARQGGPANQLILRLLEHGQRLLLTILLVNTMVNITYFALAGWWTGQQNGPLASTLIAAGSLAVIILSGEILPKVLASSDPARYSYLVAPPLFILSVIVAPICVLIERLLPFVTQTATRDASETINEEELKLVISESHRRGVVSNLAHDRLLEIIDLSTTPVLEVMTHRVDCPTIAVDADEDTLRDTLRDRPHPYLLVMDSDHNEDCIGLLTAMDVLRGGTVRQRMRKGPFIPEGAILPQAIALFQQTGRTAAVVVDEYGGPAGLLTLSHIGRALLGDGHSEDLPDIPEAEQLDEHAWRISGQTPLEYWLPLLALEDDAAAGATTVGGFVTHVLGAVPQVGDRVLHRNLEFRVASVDRRRIDALIVTQLPASMVRRMSAEMSS